MLALSRADVLTRRQPVDRQIVVGICKFAAGLAGARRLTAVRVGIPCGGSDLVELDGEPIERRVHKSFEKALAKFVLGQARTGHSLARRCIRHRRLRSLQSRPAFQGTRAVGTSTDIDLISFGYVAARRSRYAYDLTPLVPSDT